MKGVKFSTKGILRLQPRDKAAMLVDNTKEIFLQNLHQNRVHFPAERNSFVFDHQHGCRDVTCKPAIRKGYLFSQKWYIKAGAIIGDGDRKRGVHAKPSKKTNVLFLAKIAPPSTSQTRAGTRQFAWGSVTRFKLGSKLDYMLSTKALIKLSL